MLRYDLFTHASNVRDVHVRRIVLYPGGLTVQDTNGDRLTQHDHYVQGFEAAVRRAEAEFLEMPGLKLTEAQAARLWSCDADVAMAVLTRLTESLFLIRTRSGAFCRA